MSTIEIIDLSYKYPLSNRDVLSSITLKLEEGKTYGVIGENGSGKTTLAEILVGFIPHFYKGDIRGDVNILNMNLVDTQINDFVGKIGYVFQNPFNQISGIKDSVFEEVAYGLENLGIEPDEIKDRVQDILELMKIEELANRNPFELSGGQQQKVAIASILVMNPKVIILDEPVSQFDPISSKEIYKIVKEISSNTKIVIILEQNLDRILEICDEIILLKNGKILSSGTVDKVLYSSKLVHSGIRISDKLLFLQRKNKSEES